MTDAGASPHPAYDASGSAMYISTGGKYVNQVPSAYGDSYTTADVIGFALDADGQTLECFKNNVSQGEIDLSAADPGNGWTAGISDNTGSAGGSTTRWNFGQHGFTYTPPSGFLSVCSANLPVPEILEGNKGFDIILYTGDDIDGREIIGLDFTPDLVWVKSRNQDKSNFISDQVRGALKAIGTNSVSAEYNPATSSTGGGIDTSVTGGFSVVKGTVDPGLDNVNKTAYTYVAWNWKEGTKYGFDIVGYEGTGVARTVAHNLGVAPEMMIVKNRDSAYQWVVYHKQTTATHYLGLNLTDAAAASTVQWNDTEPTSSVFTLGVSLATNESGSNIISYLFTSVEGFSKVFGYTGNGNADGPFVYCGFRPRYVLLKRSDSAASWKIHDTTRDIYNVTTKSLYPDLTSAEYSASNQSWDILSNGFKIRDSNTDMNASAGNFIGIAFAEHPFKYANAR